jgi:hypothetical protein
MLSDSAVEIGLYGAPQAAQIGSRVIACLPFSHVRKISPQNVLVKRRMADGFPRFQPMLHDTSLPPQVGKHEISIRLIVSESLIIGSNPRQAPVPEK